MSALERAIALAAPYILHPPRVMMRVDSLEAKMAPVLYAVVEDCKDRGFDVARLEREA